MAQFYLFVVFDCNNSIHWNISGYAYIKHIFGVGFKILLYYEVIMV